jgi:hypothetical protein
MAVLLSSGGASPRPAHQHDWVVLYHTRYRGSNQAHIIGCIIHDAALATARHAQEGRAAC